jgi:hypothetical protein
MMEREMQQILLYESLILQARNVIWSEKVHEGLAFLVGISNVVP